MCLSFPLHAEDRICLWSKWQLLAHVILGESIIWWEQALNLRCALKRHIDSGDFSDAYHLVVLQEGDKYERGDIIYWQMSKYGIAAVRVIGLMFFSAF